MEAPNLLTRAKSIESQPQQMDMEPNHDFSKAPKKRKRKKTTTSTTERPDDYAVNRRSATKTGDEDGDRALDALADEDDDEGVHVDYVEDPIAAAVEEEPDIAGVQGATVYNLGRPLICDILLGFSMRVARACLGSR